MDNIVSAPSPKVTTGPLPSSQKVYVTPERARPQRAPARDRAQRRPPSRGPRLRHDRALHRFVGRDRRQQGPGRRGAAWVLQRGGVEEYDGRPIAPIDNGNVKSTALKPFPSRRGRCAAFRTNRSPNTNGRAPASSPRKWSTSPSAKLGRKVALDSPRSGWPTARALAPRCLSSSRPSSCARDRDGPRHHPGQHQSYELSKRRSPRFSSVKINANIGTRRIILVDGGRGRENGVVIRWGADTVTEIITGAATITTRNGLCERGRRADSAPAPRRGGEVVHRRKPPPSFVGIFCETPRSRRPRGRR